MKRGLCGEKEADVKVQIDQTVNRRSFAVMDLTTDAEAEVTLSQTQAEELCRWLEIKLYGVKIIRMKP